MLYLSDSPRNVSDIARIDMYDDIYEHESLFRNLDEPDDYYTHDCYYIGLSFYDNSFNTILLASTVQNKTFFQYKFTDIIDYLNNYSILYQNYIVQPEIMQLKIDDTMMYNVVIKTFWIKIIQRNWRRIYKERKNIIINAGSLLQYIKNNEYGIKQRALPQLQGMLYHLKEE